MRCELNAPPAGEKPITRSPTRSFAHAAADAHDASRELVAESDGFVFAQRIDAERLHQVAEVQPGGGDLDFDFPDARRAARMAAELQRVHASSGAFDFQRIRRRRCDDLGQRGLNVAQAPGVSASPAQRDFGLDFRRQKFAEQRIAA